MSGYAMTQLAGHYPVKWGTSRLFVYIQKTKVCNSEGVDFDCGTDFCYESNLGNWPM